MKKYFSLCFLTLCCLYHLSWAQQSQVFLTGTVTDSASKDPLAAASVYIKGAQGTSTDANGVFKLRVSAKFPITIIFSAIGYETLEIRIENANSTLEVEMKPSMSIEQPIVVSPTRVAIQASRVPVSFEYVGLSSIRHSAAPSYYDLISTKKGIDVTTSSLNFKTFSTRGFNGSGSARVNQLMDGMDNQAPGLNFPVGNFIGLTELDVESMEILPGASSALYGPGGMNGTILINSKNPFKYQGFSFLARQGIMHLGNTQRDGSSGFSDFAFRWAKSFGNRFAMKIGAEYIRANDWLANDTSNYKRIGTFGSLKNGNRGDDPAYDGVNVYGDELSFNLRKLAPLPGIPDTNVSRTGYQEKDIVDPETKNIKVSGALHYKLTDAIDASIGGHWAKGTTVYTGNNRYVLNGIKMGQFKAELRHADWFLRAYTTQENAGDTYTATLATIYTNEAWKSSQVWYPQYIGAFLQAKGAGMADVDAHKAARNFADIGRPAPGSDAFRKIFDSVSKVPVSKRGGKFIDESDLWMYEGQYNFSKLIKFAEIVAGGNMKKYVLNSQGTIFIDTAGSIKVNEWGGYLQITKKFLDEKLSISASGRYDKNDNFDGKFTPRVAALIQPATDHFIRVSYQTAYRFPTTQQQYIRLDVGEAVILGGLPWINDYMKADQYPTYFYVPGAPPTPYTYSDLKPETMRSFELGYKAIFNKRLMIDVYGYMGQYDDFLGRTVVIQPTRPVKPFSIVANTANSVKTYGFGLGLEQQLRKNFMANFNIYSDKITDIPAGFVTYFNTPQLRMNAGFGNNGLGKKKQLGFLVNLHWQDDFFWEGELASGNVNSYTTIDAQISYKIPKAKSIIKLGGSNITNKYYKTAFGNPEIGGLYYLSLGFNL